MTYDLKNRTVVVTGGGSGVGRELCMQFASNGARVIAADIDIDGAQQTIEQTSGDGNLAIRLDVTDESSWSALRDQVNDSFGGIDVLCNNAGVFRVGTIDESPIEDWFAQSKVNIDGVILGCRAFYADFASRGSGHIVNTSSLSGLFGAPGLSTYSASKFAVVGFTQAIRNELIETGVSVSVLVPGAIDTPMNEGVDVPLEDRLIPPADVANAVIDAVRSGSNPHFIFTHPEFYELLDEHFASVLNEYAAFCEATT